MKQKIIYGPTYGEEASSNLVSKSHYRSSSTIQKNTCNSLYTVVTHLTVTVLLVFPVV